jgi:hypothetical protein
MANNPRTQIVVAPRQAESIISRLPIVEGSSNEAQPVHEREQKHSFEQGHSDLESSGGLHVSKCNFGSKGGMNQHIH